MEAGTVLLVSRGTMSGAEMIGQCLAVHEGIRCLRREDLLAIVNGYGDLATRVTARLEKAVDSYEQFSELRRPYQILMRRALLESARQGRLAYFGYTGHLLLGKLRHYVKVRLIAPVELRVARARETLGYSEAEAREYVRRLDQDRMRWARWMYGVDLRDPGLYDVCLNIERLSLEGACDLLRSVMQHPDFQPTEESVEDAENAWLATEVLGALASNAETAQLELGATAAAGVVRLVGPYLPAEDLRRVYAVAEAVEGVRGLQYEPGYTVAVGGPEQTGREAHAGKA